MALKVAVFFLLVCFVNIIYSQTCDSVSLSTTCTCTIDNPFNVLQFLERCEQPTNQVPDFSIFLRLVPGTIYQLQDEFNDNIHLKGNTVTLFDGLLNGVTYEFSTCDRSANGPPKGLFDTLIVLRDFEGNFGSDSNDNYPAANDNCDIYSSTDKCSYISYTHNSDSFNKIYVSVYAVTNQFSCSATYVGTSPNSLSAPLFFSITATPACTDVEYIVCGNSVPNVAFNYPISLSELINYDICDDPGIEAIYYSRDGINFNSWPTDDEYIFECDVFGEINMWFRLYDSEIQCKYNIAFDNPQKRTPTGNLNAFSCNDGPALVLDSLISNCDYGSICSFNPEDYLPNIQLECSTNKSALFYKLDSFSLTRNAYVEYLFDDLYDYRTSPSWGDEVQLIFDGYSGYNGEYVTSTSCSVTFIGLQIISVSRLGNEVVDQDGKIYFGESYFLVFLDTYSLYFDDSTGIALYVPGAPITDEDSYYVLDYDGSCSDGDGTSCEGYFTLPDESEIPEGVYEIVVYKYPTEELKHSYDPDYLYINPSKYSFGKRFVITDIVHSIANPIVHLTNISPNLDSNKGT